MTTPVEARRNSSLILFTQSSFLGVSQSRCSTRRNSGFCSCQIDCQCWGPEFCQPGRIKTLDWFMCSMSPCAASCDSLASCGDYWQGPLALQNSGLAYQNEMRAPSILIFILRMPALRLRKFKSIRPLKLFPQLWGLKVFTEVGEALLHPRQHPFNVAAVGVGNVSPHGVRTG